MFGITPAGFKFRSGDLYWITSRQAPDLCWQELFADVEVLAFHACDTTGHPALWTMDPEEVVASWSREFTAKTHDKATVVRGSRQAARA